MGQSRTGWFTEVLEDLKKREGCEKKDEVRDFCSSTHIKH
jgi:hypothetical protein